MCLSCGEHEETSEHTFCGRVLTLIKKVYGEVMGLVGVPLDLRREMSLTEENYSK